MGVSDAAHTQMDVHLSGSAAHVPGCRRADQAPLQISQGSAQTGRASTRASAPATGSAASAPDGLNASRAPKSQLSERLAVDSGSKLNIGRHSSRRTQVNLRLDRDYTQRK